MPKISICVPTHDIPEREMFLERLIKSLEMQTFQDFEVIITEEGKMAENSNAAIKKANGDIIKILYMDDFLYSPNALQNLVDNFKGGWLATGCVHTENGTDFFNAHFPEWNEDMKTGVNTIGSPSVIAFENNEPLLFDESLSYMLDCDLYVRLYERYGEPTLLDTLDVAMGLGEHQTTNIMSDQEKLSEQQYVATKHLI
jgi:hypothetical protein